MARLARGSDTGIMPIPKVDIIRQGPSELDANDHDRSYGLRDGCRHLRKVMTCTMTVAAC